MLNAIIYFNFFLQNAVYCILKRAFGRVRNLTAGVCPGCCCGSSCRSLYMAPETDFFAGKGLNGMAKYFRFA